MAEHNDHPRVRRALISVTDKSGVVDFARGLVGLGFEILSTGGTARALLEAEVPVRTLEAFTGSPEMLDGRVKTLHPRVHGGILARRDLPRHLDEVMAHRLELIDLVAVNLYDFEGALARPGSSFSDRVEEIDIGGPTLLRAAAKNHAWVIPVVRPSRYVAILAALSSDKGVDAAMRRRLALEVFEHTAAYDAAIAAWLATEVETPKEEGEGDAAFSERITRSYRRVQKLRYGENPHQRAAFYRDAGATPTGLAAAERLQGKALSYNNLLDLDAAFALVVDLGQLSGQVSAVYIKHNNPCGAARDAQVDRALALARACDPVSAFGGVVAVNQPLDLAAAEVLTETFVEAVIAPGFTDPARELLERKKNLRVLELRDPAAWKVSDRTPPELRQVRGGMLVQSRDSTPRLAAEIEKAKVVTERRPTEAEWAGLAFSWVVAKHVRSNAIVFGLGDRVVAVGAGQMSRVDSVKICRLKAGEALKGTSVASDAFFPFRDGLDHLADAGATAIAQPGGSIRDEEVIDAADQHGVAMVFTGVRHFRH